MDIEDEWLPQEGGLGLTRLLGIHDQSKVALAVISIGLSDVEKGDLCFCFFPVS